MNDEQSLKIYCDGGSRGNPGKAASAFVVEEGGRTIFKDSKYLGIETNNFAEYQAVLFALSWLSDNLRVVRNRVTIILDSELVVNQLTGLYKIKSEKLKIIFDKIKKIETGISLKIIYKNVPRERNKLADFLVNENLDRNS